MLLNITQLIFHASFFKLICAELGIDWTSAALVPTKVFVLRKLPEVQREFIRTQHLHVVASSIAKLPDDAFVSVVTADARSMLKSCLFVYETEPASVVVR